MGNALKIARIGGIDVQVHWSFVLILFYGAYTFSQGARDVVAGAIYGVVIILLVRNEAMLVVWAVAQGLTMGSFFQLQAILSPIYFGRQHIGAIRGMMWMPMNFAAGIAPLALERLHAWRGDYNAAFLMVLAFWLVTALLVFLSRQPRGMASLQNR